MDDARWVSARQAVDLFMQLHDERAAAANALRDMAAANGVATLAASAVERHGPQEVNYQDWPIPSGVWGRVEGVRAESLGGWDSGSFRISLGHEYQRRTLYEKTVAVAGVVFDRAHLIAHVQATRPPDAGIKADATEAPGGAQQKPRIPDPALDRYIQRLENRGVLPLLTQEEIGVLARAAHPNNSIRRSQIEARTSGRKRGPRSNSPAK